MKRLNLLQGLFFFVAIWLFGCVSTQTSQNVSPAVSPYQGPLIDAHAHFTPGVITVDGLMTILDQAKVDRIVLLADPVTLKDAKKRYGSRIIPFLSPYVYYKEANKKQMTQSSLISAQGELETGFYSGFGEHLLRLHPIKFAPSGVHVPPDDPVMLKIYDMAATYHFAVTVHVDAPYHKELSSALSHNRQAKIIWAHCGYADHGLIRSMLDEHPNLYADLSVIADKTKKRHRKITTSDGLLLPEWKTLFEDYSKRLMIGSDMGAQKKRYQQTARIMNSFRNILGQLSEESARDIGYRTISGIVDQ